MSQLDLFDNPRRTVGDVLEKHVDYSDLGKTQAMERDLDLLIDFVNEYSDTMIPLLDNYLRNKSGK
tara:strand:+ start:289 stop:486 length:198 start_codon:yes stop_codon:yes gene_type:complete